MHIYAIGQDPYWLEVIKNMEVAGMVFDVTRCPSELVGCLDSLPIPSADSLILVDASGQTNIVATVQNLRDQGWRYVIVVAADQNAKQATAVLRKNLAFDYWEKTLDIPPIKARIATIVEEIISDR